MRWLTGDDASVVTAHLSSCICCLLLEVEVGDAHLGRRRDVALEPREEVEVAQPVGHVREHLPLRRVATDGRSTPSDAPQITRKPEHMNHLEGRQFNLERLLDQDGRGSQHECSHVRSTEGGLGPHLDFDLLT